MAKIQNGDLILNSNEVIKFPNTQISDDGSLTVTGNASIDASRIQGIEVDMNTLVDQGILTYDQASGKIKFITS